MWNAQDFRWPLDDWHNLSVILARIGFVLLLLLALWLAVRWLMLLVAGPDIEVRAFDAPAPPVPGHDVRDGGDIAALHLFGQAAGADPLLLQSLPETSLELELRGIVAGTDGAGQGYAIIVSSDGREWVYGVGDRLSDRTEVIAITPRQVVLERNGERETLTLPQHRDHRQAGTGTTGVRIAGQSTAGDAANTMVGAGVTGLTGLRGAGLPAVTAAQAGSIGGVRLDSANLARMAQMVQVTPASGGGYRVFPGRDAKQFSQIGLQANDVITAVNGQPLTDARKAMEIFQNLGQQASITITVRRDGQVMQLQPDLSKLQPQ